MATVTHLLVGLFFLTTGLYGVVYPYKMAKFGEQLDAIGSKRPSYHVEPTNWNVSLTRIVSIFIVVCGIAIISLGV
jgi:hypothetical protein